MKELEGEELKQSFRGNLKDALNSIKNPEASIVFIFKIDIDYEKKETINYHFGDLKYKGVDLGPVSAVSINIIVNNLYYDHFAFARKEVKIGETECHGFGDFWGTDRIKLIYRRLK